MGIDWIMSFNKLRRWFEQDNDEEEVNTMTTRRERTRAVLNTERFLIDLCDPKKYPRVPKAVREQAEQLLRHYPRKFDMIDPAESFEEVEYKEFIGKNDESL